jgi:hypothetical protein
MQNSLDMTYIRAVVSDEEKEAVKKKAGELGLNESQLIRRGLKKMGVAIEVEKAVGVATGTVNNPDGKGGRGKLTPELIKAIRSDHAAKMSWKELSEKHGVSLRTISKALAEEI